MGLPIGEQSGTILGRQDPAELIPVSTLHGHMNAKAALQFGLLGLLVVGTAYGVAPDKSDRFRQLEEILPTANSYRTASGAPGHEYWQQRVDYAIDVRLDEEEHKLIGSETVRYYNNSPDTLTYLWFQLDQNRFSADSHSVLTAMGPDLSEGATFNSARRLLAKSAFDGGMRVSGVTDGEGEVLAHVVNDTMMRVDLARPLLSGASVYVSLSWEHNINNVFPPRIPHERLKLKRGERAKSKDKKNPMQKAADAAKAAEEGTTAKETGAESDSSSSSGS